MIETPLLSYY